MSIIRAIEKAYQKAKERKYDKIYFSIDLHDTIIKGNYVNGTYDFINDDVKRCLQMLSRFDEVVLILWSSLLEEGKEDIRTFLEFHGIYFDYINCNPDEENTFYADFSQKFYFSVLIDDKAGFDPDYDWHSIMIWYQNRVADVDFIF
jgi:hypothetical protein